VDIKTHRRGSVVVAEISGELDSSHVAVLSATLNPKLDAGNARWVFDLAGVTFVSSTALGLLLATAKQAKAGGGELVVARPSSFVSRVLMTLGVGVALRSFPSVDAALAHFGVDGAAGAGRSRRR
jgi:anti-sigma B factor antagonist